jgi:hypothetical protein
LEDWRTREDGRCGSAASPEAGRVQTTAASLSLSWGMVSNATTTANSPESIPHTAGGRRWAKHAQRPTRPATVRRYKALHRGIHSSTGTTRGTGARSRRSRLHPSPRHFVHGRQNSPCGEAQYWNMHSMLTVLAGATVGPRRRSTGQKRSSAHVVPCLDSRLRANPPARRWLEYCPLRHRLFLCSCLAAPWNCRTLRR